MSLHVWVEQHSWLFQGIWILRSVRCEGGKLFFNLFFKTWGWRRDSVRVGGPSMWPTSTKLLQVCGQMLPRPAQVRSELSDLHGSWVQSLLHSDPSTVLLTDLNRNVHKHNVANVIPSSLQSRYQSINQKWIEIALFIHEKDATESAGQWGKQHLPIPPPMYRYRHSRSITQITVVLKWF